MVGQCKLCNKEKPLLKESHIFPKFLFKYGGLFDNDHKVYLRSYNKKKDAFFVKKFSNVLYDQNTLCSDCDNHIIGEVESYSKRLIFGELYQKEAVVISNSNDSIIIEEVNYAKLKLFILSIIWRSSISQNKFLISFKLDPEIEYRMRTMILNQDPGESSVFPIGFMTTLSQTVISHDYVLQPILIEDEHFTVCSIGFTGFIIHIYLSWDDFIWQGIRNIVLQKDAPLIVKKLSGEEAKKIIYTRAGIAS